MSYPKQFPPVFRITPYILSMCSHPPHDPGSYFPHIHHIKTVYTEKMHDNQPYTHNRTVPPDPHFSKSTDRPQTVNRSQKPDLSAPAPHRAGNPLESHIMLHLSGKFPQSFQNTCHLTHSHPMEAVIPYPYIFLRKVHPSRSDPVHCHSSVPYLTA